MKEENISETKYKIETTDMREMNLILNANRMVNVLYDLLNWRRAIYNGKNYGEGCVLYKGKLYSKDEWLNIKHTPEEYKENGFSLKDEPKYLYTEDEIERILGNYLDSISDFVYNYFE